MSRTVFISYNHRDESWKDRMVTQLATLEREHPSDGAERQFRAILAGHGLLA